MRLSASMGFDETWLVKPTAKPKAPPKAQPKPLQWQGDPRGPPSRGDAALPLADEVPWYTPQKWQGDPRGPPSRGDAALPLADEVPWYTPQPKSTAPLDLDPAEEQPAPTMGLGGKPAMPRPPSMCLDPYTSVLPPLVPVPVPVPVTPPPPPAATPTPPAANSRARIQERLTEIADRSAASDAALSQRHWLPSAAGGHHTSPGIAAVPEEVPRRFSCVFLTNMFVRQKQGGLLPRTSVLIRR
jgi:hypothetical protein